MKSTSLLANERALGNPGTVPGEGTDSISKFKTGLSRINQELWLVLSLFVIAGLFNWLVESHRMILGLYTLPTIFSAYVYGRRHAVLTATASIFIVLILMWKNTGLFAGTGPFALSYAEWSEIVTWACLLEITAYAMGTLYDKKERHMVELRQTYFGLLTILQQFISNDRYTHNHSYRVAFYASSIATQMGFDQDRVDDVRAAALLHNVGKLKTSRQASVQGGQPHAGGNTGMRKHVQRAWPCSGRLGDRSGVCCRHSCPSSTSSTGRDIVPPRATRFRSKPACWPWRMPLTR